MGQFFTTSFWMWIPTLTILPLIPIMCYYDWKYREIPSWVIDGIFIVNTPVLAFMYFTGAYGPEEAIVTILPVVIFYIIMRLWGDYFHGDDFMIAAAICLFCVVNPLRPDAGGVGVAMMIYLVGISILSFGLMAIYNVLKSKTGKYGEIKKYNTKEFILLLLSSPKGGFPFIFPIAAAFLAALIL